MGHTTGEDLNPVMWTVATEIHDVTLTLNSVAHTNISRLDLEGSAGMIISLSHFEGKFTSDRVDVGVHRVSVDMGHSSPEYAAVTGLALADSAENLSRTYQRWRLRTSTSTRDLLFGLLVASVDKFIIDPYSTIQPSYLVQRGRPNQLRTDATLVLLHHLRRCLGDMGPSERQAIWTAQTGLEPDILNKLLESRLVTLALEADASHGSNLPILERLFPSLRRQTQEQVLAGCRPPFAFGSLRMERFDLTVRDPDRKFSPSRFSITALAITARMRSPKLISPNSFTSATLSQTSLRDRSRYSIRQYSASIFVGDINLFILPHLMRFAQQVLRVRRRYGTIISPHSPATAGLDSNSSKPSTESMHLVLTFSMRSCRVEAAAENLICVFGLSGIHLGSVILAKPAIGLQGLADQSMNHSVVFDQIFLRARSNVDTSKRSDSDILASLSFSGGKCDAVMHLEPSSGTIMRTVLFLQNLQLNVPRSAIRLYRFVEEWRADFLPGIEATLHALLSEIEKGPTKPTFSAPARLNQKKPRILHVHTHISSFGVSLQVMHGTWLSWVVHHIVAYLEPSATTTRETSQSFGLQLTSQVFSIACRPNRSREITADTQVELELPTLSVSGRYSDSSLYTLACVEFFQLIVKPSHWDTLLVVQQKFGQDFNDLISLVEETRQRRAAPVKQAPALSTSLNYNGFLKMRGFRIGLKGFSSTLFLECEDIGGGISSEFGRSWNVALSDLALSLAAHTRGGALTSGFNPNHKCAFVIIDFQAGASSRGSEGVKGQTLRVSVTKIHAVMQPSSIGEVGDFIDHLQVRWTWCFCRI